VAHGFCAIVLAFDSSLEKKEGSVSNLAESFKEK